MKSNIVTHKTNRATQTNRLLNKYFTTSVIFTQSFVRPVFWVTSTVLRELITSRRREWHTRPRKQQVTVMTSMQHTCLQHPATRLSDEPAVHVPLNVSLRIFYIALLLLWKSNKISRMIRVDGTWKHSKVVTWNRTKWTWMINTNPRTIWSTALGAMANGQRAAKSPTAEIRLETGNQQ